MRRRQFILGLAGVAALAAFPAHAQQQLPVVGLVGADSEDMRMTRFAAFHQGLADAGYVEGRNVTIEYRWVQGHVERYPELVADFVRRQVAVIVSLGGIPGVTAAKAATTTIPVVFSGGLNPVEIGVVKSLARPGGNLTGATSLSLSLGPKRLEVMQEMLPAAKTFALLVNPDHPNAERQMREFQAAARVLGLQTRIVHARAVQDFEAAFTSALRLGAEGLIVGSGQPLTSRPHEMSELAIRHRMPAIHEAREFVAGGGLASYAGSRDEAYRLAGGYVGRILKGEKPADLPVQQSTKVELFVNLKAARALGIDVPLSLLGRADEVIE
jgi:putative ABC transport system substrate-binding protein